MSFRLAALVALFLAAPAMAGAPGPGDPVNETGELQFRPPESMIAQVTTDQLIRACEEASPHFAGLTTYQKRITANDIYFEGPPKCGIERPNDGVIIELREVEPPEVVIPEPPVVEPEPEPEKERRKHY